MFVTFNNPTKTGSIKVPSGRVRSLIAPRPSVCKRDSTGIPDPMPNHPGHPVIDLSARETMINRGI